MPVHSFEFLLVPFTCWVPPSLLSAPCLPVLVSLGCPSKMPHTGDLCFMEAEKSKAKAKTPFLKTSFQAGRLPPPHRGRRESPGVAFPSPKDRNPSWGPHPQECQLNLIPSQGPPCKDCHFKRWGFDM